MEHFEEEEQEANMEEHMEDMEEHIEDIDPAISEILRELDDYVLDSPDGDSPHQAAQVCLLLHRAVWQAIWKHDSMLGSRFAGLLRPFVCVHMRLFRLLSKQDFPESCDACRSLKLWAWRPRHVQLHVTRIWRGRHPQMPRRPSCLRTLHQALRQNGHLTTR